MLVMITDKPQTYRRTACSVGWAEFNAYAHASPEDGNVTAAGVTGIIYFYFIL